MSDDLSIVMRRVESGSTSFFLTPSDCPSSAICLSVASLRGAYTNASLPLTLSSNSGEYCFPMFHARRNATSAVLGAPRSSRRRGGSSVESVRRSESSLLASWRGRFRKDEMGA